jgi:membrane-associated phospholipid phosphatase
MEESILLWVQEFLRNPILNPVMVLITMLGNGGFIWIIISAGLLIPKKTRRVGLICAISLLLMHFSIDDLIKPLIGRVRPYEAIDALQALVPPPEGTSFPSGHTASSFAVAVVLFRNVKKKISIWPMMLAIFISLSRIYVGVHYPTDVIGGVIGGIICAYLAQFLYESLEKWHRRRSENEFAAS